MTEQQHINRNSTYYCSGVRAYLAGHKSVPPRKLKDNKKIEWYTGWYDTRTNERLEAVLERNNLRFP